MQLLNNISEITLDELKVIYIHAQNEKKSYAEYESQIKNEIIKRIISDAEAALRRKAEPFGTVTIEGIKFTASKKVDWDQDKLASLYKAIGATASEYIETEYKVREVSFKNWPSNIQEFFIPCRTVKPGSITIEIEKGK